jgi:hypothetical protein
VCSPLLRWPAEGHSRSIPGSGSLQGPLAGALDRRSESPQGARRQSPWVALWGRLPGQGCHVRIAVGAYTVGVASDDGPRATGRTTRGHSLVRWIAGAYRYREPGASRRGSHCGGSAGTGLPRVDRRGRQLRRVCVRSREPIHGPLTGLALSPVSGGRSSGGWPSGRPGFAAGRRLRLGR